MTRQRTSLALLLALASLAPARAGRWEPGPAILPYLSGHAMVYDSTRDAIVVFGGLTGSLSSNQTWELVGGRWIAGAPAPAGLEARDAHAMVFDSARGRAVVFGGNDGLGTQLDDTWEYDGSAWTAGAPPNPGLLARGYHAMAFDARRSRTVLFGGFTFSLTNDTWEYDGAAWSPGPTAPGALSPRAEHAMTYDAGRNVVVLFGGSDGTFRLDDTWEYDGTSWSAGPAAGPGMVGRNGAGLIYDPLRARVMLFGGSDGAAYLDDTWLYDGAGWSIGPSPGLGLAPRTRAGFVFHERRGTGVLFGGLAAGGQLRDTWEVDTIAWTSLPFAAGPSGRSGSAMVLDSVRNRLVLFGGADGQGARDDTWELSAGAWSQGPAAPPGLTPRYRHAMAFDAARGRSVLYGGLDPATHDDTWEYDGTAWTPGPAAPAGLAARGDHAMAFDETRAVTVLFGGLAGALRDDTWEFDGGGWTLGPSAPSALTPRMEHAMVWDPAAGVVMLVGGLDDAGPLRDLWTYDGAAWRIGVAPPIAARYSHAMASDAAEGSIVLHGGRNLSLPLGDGWIRIAGTWLPTGSSDPSERYGHVMGYDRGTDRMFLFSGFDGSYVVDSHEYLPGSTILSGEGHAQVDGNDVAILDGALASAGTFAAYGAGAWGVNVGAGSLGLAPPGEILTGPGPGDVHGPQVRAFRADTTPLAKVNFYAYGTLKYGVNVAGGDVERDGYDEILTGAGPGEVFGPHVRAFDVDGGTLAPIGKLNFFAYGTLKYGVNVAGGDVDADGAAELLTGPGPGAIFRPQVRGFDFGGGVLTSLAKINFDAFPVLAFGAQVASADVGGDLAAEIAAAPGPGGDSSFPGRFRGFHYGPGITALPGFDVDAFSGSYGGRVALAELHGIARSELLGGAGPDPTLPSELRTYRYDGATLLPLLPVVEAFPGNAYGATVAAGEVLAP